MTLRQTLVVAMDGRFKTEGNQREVWQEDDGSWMMREWGPRYSNTYRLTHDGTAEDLATLKRLASRWPRQEDKSSAE